MFIEYYNGTTAHKKSFEYLKKYSIINPITKEEKQQNKENQKSVEKVLAIRQAEHHQGK